LIEKKTPALGAGVFFIPSTAFAESLGKSLDQSLKYLVRASMY